MPARRSESPAIVFAIGAMALLAVVLLFQVALEPAPHRPRSPSLAPSAFQATLVPAHLGAAAILGGCLWKLGADRRGLAAVAAFALVSIVVPGVFGLVGWVAVLAAPTLGAVAVVALLIRTVLVARSVHDAAERRAAFAASA